MLVGMDNRFAGRPGTVIRHARPRPSTSASWLSPAPPAAHLAVHDGGTLEVRQEIFHLIEGLATPLDHTIVGWHKRPQGVIHQLFQAALFTLTETL